MTRNVSDKELSAVNFLNASTRYAYFVKEVSDSEIVWSIADDTGWVLMNDDQGQELVPIWPHERFAASCAIDEWDDAMPSPINLSDWIEKWTPGMLSDGRQVAVFPTREDRGMVVDPIKLSDDLKEELMNLIGCHTPKLASLPVLRPNSV